MRVLLLLLEGVRGNDKQVNGDAKKWIIYSSKNAM